MMLVFKNAKMYEDGKIITRNVSFDGVSFSSIEGDLSRFDENSVVIDNMAILPGFCDVHVHLREPGFSYKETIKSGTLASARGGYTAVCSMPNLDPVPDSREYLDVQLDIIRRDASIAVYPYGSITVSQKGEVLSDMKDMADDVIAFSDDGRGVQNEEMMISAMERAKSLNKMIVAHCEDNSLLRGGYIHDGEYARAHGHRGICSESEFGQIARDLELVKKVGCKYHVCHVSAKESVEIIRKAKAEGVDVTCETGPHYLTMTDLDLEEDGRFKMNPPIRGKEDRDALIAGIKDGTVDVLATDHAPHSAEEKSRGLEKSNMGVVGIETAFPVMYTHLVKTGVITLEELIGLMSDKPRERFGITSDCGFTVFDLGDEYEINPDEFLSMGKSTPFKGMRVYGRCLATVYGGKAAYLSEKLTSHVNKSEDK